MASGDFGRSIEEKSKPVTLVIEVGEVPKWLSGVFLRSGPGHYDFVKDHFEEFALIHNFVFINGQVTYHCKNLESASYKQFCTNTHPDVCKNTISRFLSNFRIPELLENSTLNVYQLQGNIYTATENHYIHRIDPVTLQTKETVDLNNFYPVHMVTAKPLTDHDGTTYNIGVSFTRLKYLIIKFPPYDSLAVEGINANNSITSGSTLCQLPFGRKKKFSYIHSFSITKNYIIFIEQPLVSKAKIGLSFIASQVQDCSFKDSLEWYSEEKNRFCVIEKRNGTVWKTKFISSVSHFAVNHINAYEENGHIIVDLVTYPNSDLVNNIYLNDLDMSQFDKLSIPQAQRFVLPTFKTIKEVKCKKGENLVKLDGCMAKANLCNRTIIIHPETLGPPGFDMPQINYAYIGKKYKYLYATGMIFDEVYKNALVKLNVQTKKYEMWKANEDMTFSEPVFVAHPFACNEDDGLVLAIAISFKDNIADSLRIFDAKNLTEVTRLVAHGFPLPPLFHGRYFPFPSKHETAIEE